MNSFSFRLEIKLKNQSDPNQTMGNLIKFLNDDGSLSAHLSLRWSANLWFAFYNKYKKDWTDVLFPDFFNCIKTNLDTVVFEIFLFDENLILSQNGFISKFKLPHKIEFHSVEYLKNFSDRISNHIEIENTVELNVTEISDKFNNIINRKIGKEYVHKTDIIVVGYKAINWLNICLDTLLLTYKKHMEKGSGFVKIGRVVYCDNNVGQDRELARNLVIKYKKESEDFFEVIYLENEDKTYCSNRLSAIKIGLNHCESETVTIIDSDIIFLNTVWLDIYKNFNDLNICGIGMPMEPAMSRRIRYAHYLLPRFSGSFFIINKNLLVNKLKKNPDILGDTMVEFKFGDLFINIFGFHFSGLYMDLLKNEDPMLLINRTEMFLNDHFSFKKEVALDYDVGMSFSIGIEHLESGSFAEVQKNETRKDIVDNCLNRLEQFVKVHGSGNSFGALYALDFKNRIGNMD